MKKEQALEMLAEALNLLNHLRASMEDDLPANEEGKFCGLANQLPAAARESFWNNGTLTAKDLSK